MKCLVKLYNKIILNKSSKITFAITILLIFVLVLYMLFTQKENYYSFSKLINENYIESLGTIISISMVFLITFITQRESNLLNDSFDVMEETKKGRGYIFACKQIVYCSFTILFSMLFFSLSFVPAYFIFDLLKIDFLKSYLSYLLFSLLILEMCIFIDYITKNFFITLMFSLLVVISQMVTMDFSKYVIPSINFDNGFYLNSGILYGVIYLVFFIFLNYLIYQFKDRN